MSDDDLVKRLRELRSNQYPIIIEPSIYQYDEHLFVWFDETAGVGGASNYVKGARDQLHRYAKSLEPQQPDDLLMRLRTEGTPQGTDGENQMNDDPVKRLKKWANGEAMAAYGEHLVDHPDEHEGSQISELIDTLTDRIKELEAKLAKAVEHIEWFISEDETNRGDEPMSSHGGRTWDEINEYFITHLDSAVAFVTELKGETDE
jgi:hypothetical protein